MYQHERHDCKREREGPVRGRGADAGDYPADIGNEDKDKDGEKPVAKEHELLTSGCPQVVVKDLNESFDDVLESSRNVFEFCNFYSDDNGKGDEYAHNDPSRYYGVGDPHFYAADIENTMNFNVNIQ